MTDKPPGLYPPKEFRKSKKGPEILPDLTGEDMAAAAKLLDPWLRAGICGVEMPDLPLAFDGRLAWIVLRRANRIGKRFDAGEIQLLIQYVTEDAQVIAKYPGEATRISVQRQAIPNMFRPGGEADYQNLLETISRLQQELASAEKRRGR